MKNLLVFFAICFLFLSPTYAENFNNTDEQLNEKTFAQFMSWVFDGKKSPERAIIETSNE